MTRPAARTGDAHVCEAHGGGPVTAGSGDVLINNQRAARVGDAVTCQGSNAIQQGSRGVFINRQAAARVSDGVQHGGPIVLGSPDVLVGHRGGASPPVEVEQEAEIELRIARLHADYDRDLAVQPSEYAARVIRPGHILLANLDLHGPTRPVGQKLGDLDGDLATLRDGDPDPCEIELAPSEEGAPSDDRARLWLHPADQLRVRIFDGRDRSLILGGGSSGESQWAVPTAELPVPLIIDAVTLAGDPSRMHARGEVPSPHEGTPSHDEPEEPYAQRAPGEVWIDVVSPRRAGPDVCLFTIAPFLLAPNTQPVERLFIVYKWSASSLNCTHSTVYEVCEALRRVWGAGCVDLPSKTTERITSHGPDNTKKVHVVELPAGQLDPWMQDQVCFGSTWAPHSWRHVAFHCNRQRPLNRFIAEEIAREGMGLFNGVHGPVQDYSSGGAGADKGVDYGGNIEVSPPIDAGTPALAGDDSGPPVPAHPPAPFGKIILGDCARAAVSEALREFFLAQRIQPLLPVDTSWLAVGHADEFATTVPDRQKGGQSFRLLVADPQVMDLILEGVMSVPFERRTAFHRGLHESFDEYAEIQPEDLGRPLGELGEAAPLLVMPTRDDGSVEISLYASELIPREYNARLTAHKLTPLRSRLRRGLALADADIIRVPVYFKIPYKNDADSIRQRDELHQTVALTVGSVNLQVVDDAVLVPRPYGPRVPPADARRIVQRAAAEVGLGGLAPELPIPGAFTFWCRPGQPPWRVCAYFLTGLSREERGALVAALQGMALNGSTALSDFMIDPACAALVPRMRELYERIQASNPLETEGVGFDDPEAAFRPWTRLVIPESDPMVDVIEAYWLTVLRPLGLEVYFIDDWWYHISMGEVHCGTNTIRTPREVNEPIRWWDHYEADRELRYDPVTPW